jgi:hypothetical protein
MGCGLLTAALLSDVDHARDGCAREYEAGSGCGFLGHRSACYQKSDRKDSEQQASLSVLRPRGLGSPGP